MTTMQAHAVPEEGEEAVAPGDDSNSDPTPPLPAEQGDGRESEPTKRPVGSRKEPEIAYEQDISSHGDDTLVEGMVNHLKPFVHTSARLAAEGIKTNMATDPNLPPPEPIQPISSPPNPGQVQPTPRPM